MTPDGLLDDYEISYLEKQPEALQLLIDWHDSQESEADAMGEDEYAERHRLRRRYLQAMKENLEAQSGG